MRYNRTNCFISDIYAIRKLFWNRLRNRGYPPWFLRQVFLTVTAVPTYPAKKPKKKTQSSHKSVVFTTTFHPIMRNSLHLLKYAFGTNTAQIRFRSTKRLFY